jgi:hypothetical protein
MNSDHSPIKMCLSSENLYSQNHTESHYHTDWEKFKNNLPSLRNIDHLNDIQELNKFVLNAISSSFENSTSVKTTNFKHKKAIPYYIRKLIISKKKAKNRTKKSKKDEDKKKYNILNSLVKDELEAFNNKNWEDFISGLNHMSISSKPFWDRINLFKGNKASTFSYPTLIENAIEYKEDKEKGDLFASKLELIFSDSNSSNFDNYHKCSIEYFVDNFNSNSHKNPANYFSMEDLNQALNNLKIKSSPGPDKITNIQLKNLSEEFKKIVLKLFNLTIEKSLVPDSWKLSTVTMIPKKVKNSSNPKDYRPISLTSCLAKLCEKLILQKLNSFLEKNKIIIKQQSGFRKHRQTKDNIIVLIQKITESFNRKKKVFGVFFDIAAAFDKVWHKGLIFKMINHKIPSEIVLWVQNFLTDRSFKVKINNLFSDSKSITAGVPQGAILSPILFSIFINDVPKIEKKNVGNSLLFADDLASFLIFRKVNNKLRNSIKLYLLSIETWLCKWRLTMAPSKCNYIIFSKFNKNNAEGSLNPTLFNESIPETKSVTFLGIRFDKNLNFRDQLDYLIEVSTKRLNILKILANKNWKISTKILTKIYSLLIRSILDYSSCIFSCLSEENKKKLQTIQNNALRVILHKPKFTPISELHKISNLETIKNRFNKLNCRYVFRNLAFKNELIQDMVNEYLNFSATRTLSYSTPLCFIKNQIIIYLDSLNPP